MAETATKKSTRLCNGNILGDLIRARSIAAAAREAVSNAATVEDREIYVRALETATTSLDTAIALAEKNLPKPLAFLEEPSFNV